MTDPVTSPDHYRQGEIECLDAIEASMTPEEFLGFLKGNVIKYLWRWRHKGSGSKDIAKAIDYLSRMPERVRAEEGRKTLVGPCGPAINPPPSRDLFREVLMSQPAGGVTAVASVVVPGPVGLESVPPHWLAGARP